MSDENKNVITIPSLGYMPHPAGLGCTIFEKMWENEDKIAQIDALTGAEETYKSLLKRCIRTALALRSKGITRDDVITICTFNNMDACVPYIAALFLGAKPCALDPTLSLIDTVHLLKQVNPKIIFVGLEAVELTENATKELNIEIVIFGNTSKYTPFSDFLKTGQEEDDFKPVPAKDLKDTVAILFSSGTSGLAKGICLNHYGMLSASYTVGHLLPTQRSLPFASLYWISSVCILVCTTMYGGSRVVVPRFNANEIWKLFSNYKVTMTFLAPSYAIAITKTERPKDVQKLALKFVLLSGGPMPERYLRAFQNMIPEAAIAQAYGQTETTGLVSFFKVHIPEEMNWVDTKPTSSGTIVPGYSIKIVDVDTEEILGPNRKGELRIKSDMLMSGYHNLDSSDTWDSDGWLRTGDIAYYDDDNCLYVVDRIKEMLKFQSFHVPPAALEVILLQHPAVEGAVVIGIPHEEDGDHPMALVVLSKNCGNVSPKDIEKFVEERVNDKQRLRAGVKFIEEIPRTPTGKIKRKDLRDKVLRGEL